MKHGHSGQHHKAIGGNWGAVVVLALVGVVAVLVCFLLSCCSIAAMERELVLNNWPFYRLQASRSCTHTVQRNYHYGTMGNGIRPPNNQSNHGFVR